MAKEIVNHLSLYVFEDKHNKFHVQLINASTDDILIDIQVKHSYILFQSDKQEVKKVIYDTLKKECKNYIVPADYKFSVRLGKFFTGTALHFAKFLLNVKG